MSRSSSDWTPARITTSIWLDPSDMATAYQDSAGTTAGAVSSPVGKRLDKSGNNLHVVQATSAARPTLDLTSGIYSDAQDGIDDGYSTATFSAGTLGADMDCFVAIKRNGTAKGVVGVFGTGHFAYFESGASANSTHLAGGTASSYLIDGVAVPGGTSVTGGQLHTALTADAWHILEVRNLQLSGWTLLGVGGYSGYPLNASIAGVVLCPAQSAENRTKIRTYLADKVGVTL